MTIQEMHYDFKTKLNKVDSQQYKNLRIPEIDWALNEAQELFVKMVAKPRMQNHLGFETTQRAIDDIRPLVVETTDPVTANVGLLPADYWHFISVDVDIDKGTCPTETVRVFMRQHDDDFESSPFDRSSFEWRTVNGVFNQGGIEFFTDGTFTVSNMELRYIKKLRYIHNAASFTGGTYNLPNGVDIVVDTGAGRVDCELPDHTHREIVDIAVLVVTGQIEAPGMELKMQKLNLNNLK